MGKERLCAMCGEIFYPANSDQDAAAEYEKEFGLLSADDYLIVCDNCYQLIDPAKHPDKLEEAKRKFIDQQEKKN